MRPFIRKYSAVLLIILPVLTVSAQDIHFSQYNLTPLIINPAQTGAYKVHEVILNYKSQWTSVTPNAYKTMNLSYDGRFKQKQWRTHWLAGGVNVFNDKAGDGNLRTTQGNLYIGYHTQVGARSTLGGCLTGGFAQRSIDFSKLTWDEQYVNGAYSASAPSNEPAGDSKSGFADFGMGLLYQYAKGQLYSTANDMVIIHAGIALAHLNRPAYSFYGAEDKLYVKTTTHFDALVGIKNTSLSLLPGFVYMQQGPASEVVPGCYFRYMLREESKLTGYVKGAALLVGTQLRLKDAFIPSIQLDFAEYTIGLSYDMNVSGLKTATSGKGGFEISLRYGNPNPFLYKSAASFE